MSSQSDSHLRSTRHHLGVHAITPPFDPKIRLSPIRHFGGAAGAGDAAAGAAGCGNGSSCGCGKLVSCNPLAFGPFSSLGCFRLSIICSNGIASCGGVTGTGPVASMPGVCSGLAVSVFKNALGKLSSGVGCPSGIGRTNSGRPHPAHGKPGDNDALERQALGNPTR